MNLFKRKKKEKVVEKTHEEIMDEIHEYGLKNAKNEAERRYYEAQMDKEYQYALSSYYSIVEEIRETYTVINNLSSFDSEAGDKLVERCIRAINIDDLIRDKRDYYDSATYEYCDPYKILCMIFEKREEYKWAASVCVASIQKGYTKDGTSGGMRGRLARIIKKGGLPLTEEMKEILNL